MITSSTFKHLVPLAKANDRLKWRGQLPTHRQLLKYEEANAQQYQFNNNNLKGSYNLQFTRVKDIWSVARDRRQDGRLAARG